MRGAVRSTAQRRLFSTALNRSRSVVTSRAALLSLRSVSSPCSYAPIAPRQQRWYTTDDNKEVGSEVATDSVQDAIKKVRLNFLPPSRPEALTLTRAVQVVSEYPCVVFMKGTPDAPQCGFSNATIKALNTVGTATIKALRLRVSALLRWMESTDHVTGRQVPTTRPSMSCRALS